MTAVSGTTEPRRRRRPPSVKIRLQHDFRAQDITFTGSAAGAKVTSIFFGDRVVWSSSDGIDVAVFGSTSFLRGLLKGQSIRAGLDITVNGSSPALATSRSPSSAASPSTRAAELTVRTARSRPPTPVDAVPTSPPGPSPNAARPARPLIPVGLR
jgi:hypothetical protein